MEPVVELNVLNRIAAALFTAFAVPSFSIFPSGPSEKLTVIVEVFVGTLVAPEAGEALKTCGPVVFVLKLMLLLRNSLTAAAAAPSPVDADRTAVPIEN